MRSKKVVITFFFVLGLVLPCYAQSTTPTQRVADFTLRRCYRPDSITLSNFVHRPVLLYFFDAGDASMLGGYPYLDAWSQRYTSDSLVVIGIHCPQYEPAKNKINACTAVARSLVKSPIVLDLELDVFKAYGKPKLPYFLLLRPGLTPFYSTSNPRPYLEVDSAIQKILRELNPTAPIAFPVKPLKPVDDPNQKLLPSTAKIDLGYTKAKIAGCDSTRYDRFAIYEDTGERERNTIYLDGRWKVEASRITCQSDNKHLRHSIRLIYSGKTVWMLFEKPPDSTAKVFIKQDGSYLPTELWGTDLRVDADTGRPWAYSKYDVPLEIINNQRFGSHQLQIIVEGSDLSFYYFYFEPEVAP